MKKKLVIIGGGVAGLSAGIYGQLNGYNTEILEMHSRPGGQCTSWKRSGYTFDYCIHWLVGSSHGPFYNIWKETGALDDSTKVIDHDTYVTLRTTSGEEVVIYSDIDRWQEYLIHMAPEDEPAVRKLCRDMRRTACLEMIEKSPGNRNLFDQIRFVIKSAPTIVVVAKHSRKTVREYFKGLGFKNVLLTEALVGMAEAMEKFSAFAFLLTLSWFSRNNAGYPVGGSMPFSMRMEGRYNSLGGRFTGGAKVEKIITQENRAVGVRLVNGEIINADYVIGACDLHAIAYDMLDGNYLSKKMEKAFSNWPLFKPIVQVSVGINRPIDSGDHTYHMLASGEHIGTTDLVGGYTVTNYNHDPVITPAGKCVMKLCFDSPFEKWESISEEDYSVEKEKIREDAIKKLEQLYPAVKGHIEVVDVATPLTGVKYTGVWKGAYEGFLPASSNIGMNLKMTLGNLQNFYLAGQWLSPGGGLPPSAQSGKWIVETICNKDRKKFRVC